MTIAVSDSFQQYRAPQQDQAALVDPDLSQLTQSLLQPPALTEPSGVEFCGKSLRVARQQARAEVVQLAYRFTSRYRDVEQRPILADTPIIMSGHQPELFHPGVWFKNFLLSRLAHSSEGIAINFLVDNDLCRNAAIRVPGLGPTGSIVAQAVPFDAQRESLPWELRRLNSIADWESFPARVSQCLAPGAGRPLLEDMWPEAVASIRECNRIGWAIAQARHKLEQQIGLDTLEVPLSQLVATRAFARFSIQLLSSLPRFQDVYNSQLQRYREAHHIRNHAHPVPALEQTDGWLEAPWWIYREASPRRQRMWVRLLDDQLMLSDRAGWQAVIEGRLDCDNAATQWLEILADGICLRPRALLTTMYLRLFVSNLFVHGIGGGKYDQLTNAIIHEYFGIEPPPMCVATATLRLPIQHSLTVGSSRQATEQQIREQREQLWQTQFHADDLADELSSEAVQLAQQKKQLLDQIPPRGEKWEWHRQMTAVNKRLSELAAERLEASKQAIERLHAVERQQKILESREFSFCLFPRDYAADALHRLCDFKR